MDKALKKDELLNRVLLGDIREVYNCIPNQFVQSVITSPPYFGHRKYSGVDACPNEIGREKTLQEYVNNLISCFELIKPKLKDYNVILIDTAGRHNLDRELARKNGMKVRAGLLQEILLFGLLVLA